MPRSRSVVPRLQRRLACHQALYDPHREPRNNSRWLPELRRWQAQRLESSFAGFLGDPRSAPAAHFFLTDVYGEHDFSRRDADIAKVLPMMQRLLPEALLRTVADGIELGALTQAFDLRMAEVLERLAPTRRRLDESLYARAYREVGLPRLRRRQVELIGRVGHGLSGALRMPGVATLLRLSRGPAKAAGLGQLQGFLERGFEAFAALGDAHEFLGRIDRNEREVSRRLFAGESEPFREVS
ncbi:hypothetical protein IP90_01743 [Luteimonas cucumeris]|uniref:DUF8198 domain-containing protein n=1 Tax=Luteimonas cucumeris TaxID=985012 RepID=A0A562L8Y4_9GAMM|nr:hypothetical protein [Luteimonas cucumeris]TWI03924.1 hypothetical protein IP90_01743 [Luteimonas cucumeris]